ncbi:hypothetical protein [Mycolicibacterium mageritense]
MLEVLPGGGVGAGFDDALLDEVNGSEAAEFGEVSGSILGGPIDAHVREFTEVVRDPRVGFVGDLMQVPLTGIKLRAA